MNLEGANSGGLRDGSPSGVQGRSPGRGSGGRSPPEADDFSQLKGYLDATSGILGGMDPCPPLLPLKSASVFLRCRFNELNLSDYWAGSRRQFQISGGSTLGPAGGGHKLLQIVAAPPKKKKISRTLDSLWSIDFQTN